MFPDLGPYRIPECIIQGLCELFPEDLWKPTLLFRFGYNPTWKVKEQCFPAFLKAESFYLNVGQQRVCNSPV